MLVEEIKCPICRLSQEKALIEVQGIKLVECQGCGLIYINPRIKKDELMSLYPHTYHSKGGLIRKLLEGWLSQFSNVRKRLTVLSCKKKGRILDLGCGTGGFLCGLNDKYWDKYGIEPNQAGYNMACGHNNIKAYQEELHNCRFPGGYFDVITAWVVLEYIGDPVETLMEIRRVLKDDGIFIFTTPNAGGLGFRLGGRNWFHLDFPRHFFLYNKNSLRVLLNVAGLKIIKIKNLVLDNPFDLFHSLIDSGVECVPLKNIFILPFVILSLMIKPILCLLRAPEMMEVFAKKSGA